MSTIALGGKSQFLVGGTDITGVASGLETITYGVTHDARAVPGGRGVAHSQEGNFSVYSFTIACESNELHDPVFRTAHMQRAAFVFRPEGAGSGLPQYSGSAVMQVSVATSAANNSVIWTVQFAVDGEPTLSNQS